jgi:collagen type VII alpha
MAVNFPDSPVNGETFTANDVVYEYDSIKNKWTAVNYASAPIGFTGSKGDIGFTGSKGDLGFSGSIGFTGSLGPTGFVGSKGEVGFTGSRGFTGSQGAGFTGSQGATGNTGFTGSAGTNGFTGSAGTNGFTGSRGNTGFTGSAGPSTTINATNDTSATTHYPVFVAAAGSNQTARVRTTSTALSYVPSTGALSATTFSGALSGNATTATTLQTARTINGTSFNGSANITTANWGTARTIWGQSINGSANITAPVLPAAGSVSAPAFSTSSDTNTGIFFPAADTLAFAEGGVEAMRIDSSGNVGIGKTSITAKLDVNGSLSATSITETSSIRYKENIRDISDSLSIITQMKGVEYNRKDSDKDEIGLIAEDLYAIAPSLVKLDSEGRPDSIHYTRIVAYLVEAVKELEKKIG